MPETTAYRFGKIHSGLDLRSNRAGEQWQPSTPALRIWIDNKRPKLIDIPLTEEGLTEIIQQAARCLAVQRIDRERLAYLAAEAAREAAAQESE